MLDYNRDKDGQKNLQKTGEKKSEDARG
jgi:hypothetical protein